MHLWLNFINQDGDVIVVFNIDSLDGEKLENRTKSWLRIVKCPLQYEH